MRNESGLEETRRPLDVNNLTVTPVSTLSKTRCAQVYKGAEIQLPLKLFFHILSRSVCGQGAIV